MAGKVTAVDAGSYSVRVMTVKDGKHGLAVTDFAAFPAGEAAAGLRGSGISLKNSVAGLSGRAMTLRYSQVPPSPDWQLQNLMELEIQDMAEQSGGELSADYNLLPIADEDSGMDTVLLAFARDEALAHSDELVTGAGGSVGAHVPNAIALYNAYLRCGPVEEDATVVLVNVGHETTDIAIVRGVDLMFVRNLSSGGKVFDEAIAAAFNVRDKKAGQLKHDLIDLDPASRGRYASSQAEKVTTSAGGAGSAVVAAIQSSLAFCRQQTKQGDLQVDSILICGGSSRLRGIRGMLRESLRCPVELFDPFASADLSALSAPEHELLDSNRYEAVIALGLAATKLDDSLYQLEILPESVKRRRRFTQQTVWNIGAALVGVALIALFATTQKARVEEAEVAKRVAQRDARRYTSIDTKAVEQVERNRASRELAEYLAERAVPLHGMTLLLRALESDELMPAEFWLKLIEVRAASAKTGASGSSPVVLIKGAGKDVSGAGVGDAYQRFLTGLRGADFGSGVRPRVQVLGNNSDASGNTEFQWQVDFRPLTSDAGNDKQE